eukprot:c10629_g1_i2.p1 GENE.c10629_g1_i2~~c10629_g1_i2.p1  ORF type:complete len:664 (+),score=165.25 c10629_g1_i2:38-2029(+)
MAQAREEANNVRVVGRIRPFNDREKKLGTDNSEWISVTDNSVAVKVGGKSHVFELSRAFGSNCLQADIFKDTAQQPVKDLFDGFHATIFAYGQTGAGKSWSMFGSSASAADEGIVPRSTKYIFETIEKMKDKEFLISCSYLEIYNESISDLLNLNNRDLAIRESKSQGVYVQDLTQQFVTTPQDIYGLIRLGDEHKKKAATKMNPNSSRSHCCFTISVEIHDPEQTLTAHLNLVDLAGSERIKKSQATGAALDEAKNINSSLTALTLCIQILAEGKGGHVPFRNSKLTRLLSDSLGGNSKTTMLVALSPHIDNQDETLGSLRFAQRCSSVKTVARQNLKLSTEDLQRLIDDTKTELQRVRAFKKVPVTMSDASTQTDVEDASIKQMKAELLEKQQRLRLATAQLEEESKTTALLKDQYEALAAKVQNLGPNVSTPLSHSLVRTSLKSFEMSTELPSVWKKRQTTVPELKLGSLTEDMIFPPRLPNMLSDEDVLVQVTEDVSHAPSKTAERKGSEPKPLLSPKPLRSPKDLKEDQKSKKKQMKDRLVKVDRELDEIQEMNSGLELKLDDQNGIIARQQDVINALEHELATLDQELEAAELTKANELVGLAELEAEFAALVQEESGTSGNIKHFVQKDSVLEKPAEDGVFGGLVNMFSFGIFDNK